TSCANSAPIPVYGRLTPTFTSWACARAVVMASATTVTTTIRFIMRESLPGGSNRESGSPTAGRILGKSRKRCKFTRLGGRTPPRRVQRARPVRQCGGRTGGGGDQGGQPGPG